VAQGEYEEFLKFCTEDSKWTFVGDVVLHGKKALREWMATNYKEPPKFDVKNLISDNEFVMAMGEIKIADKNGKMILYSYCDLWRFQNNKMAELKAFVIKVE